MENNIFSKIEKKLIWKKQFGTHFTGYDVFGRFVSQCCSTDKCCSSASLVLPEFYGGKKVIENGLILSPKSMEEKGNKLYGIVNNRYFRIVNNKDGTGKIIVKDNVVKYNKLNINNK